MTPTTYKITFRLDAQSKSSVPGLPTNNSALPCVANSGETVAAVLDRLNLYRGPRHQITALWDSSGLPISLTMLVTDDATFFVRA